MRNIRSRIFLSLLVTGTAGFITASGCGGGDSRPPALEAGGGGGRVNDASMGGSSGMDMDGGGGISFTDAPADVAEPDTGPDSGNCGSINCPGASSCVVEMGTAQCVCDPGFVQNPTNPQFECIPDESCVKIRFLEGGSGAPDCRFMINGFPAVGLFFAVDTCAGTAVLRDQLGTDLAGAFRILENGMDVRDNPEASATIIERDIESFVSIVVDVSQSIVDDGLLAQLAPELRSFAQTFRAGPSEPPVSVSVVAFGRFVTVLQPFTTDLNKVDAALERIENDFQGVQSLVGGDGTSLFDGVEKGIRETERMLEFRRTVSNNGVLTSGTMVVITDGVDTSGRVPNTTLFNDTRVNMISIGISEQIDDMQLTLVGRDGSFLAPRPTDWTSAFAEISKRVDEHPDRAYLLGYCSSAVAGIREVEVSLTDSGTDTAKFTDVTSAKCNFNADLFGSQPLSGCSDFFRTGCNGVACGGFLACGACGDTQCCAVGPTGTPMCTGPSANVGGDCQGDQEVCEPSTLICADNPTTPQMDTQCRVPLAVDDVCDPSVATSECDPLEANCEDVPDGDGGMTRQCVAITKIAEGDPCADSMNQPLDPENCETLNCGRRNPNNPADPIVCLPPARMFDACNTGNSKAICESGTVCKTNCELRGPVGFFRCGADNDCASGDCDTTGSSLCRGTGFCHYSWADKID